MSSNVNTQPAPNYNVPFLTSGGQINQAWFRWITSPAVGTYNPAFGSGPVQYAGPNQQLAGSDQFYYGTQLPQANGAKGPSIVIGSGPGVAAEITTDQAYTSADAGNDLILAAGETQPAGTAQGGTLWAFGGASNGGQGGTLQLQGGTSVGGRGGSAVLQGGNSTSNVPGDAYVTGGQTGTQGANVHLIMTTVAGTSGVVRIRNNSDPIIDFYPDGSIYLYKGGGFGTAGQSLKTGGAGVAAYWG